jgi:DNA processing protein
LGTAPLPENFPSRNRILSGLALGVVIVEAAEKSGSLITARMALEQDRQVFAVPGSPLSGKTRGSNRLLREGAVLVECVEDVIEDLAPQMAGKMAGKLAGKASAPAEREEPAVFEPSPAAAAAMNAQTEAMQPASEAAAMMVLASQSRKAIAADRSTGLAEEMVKQAQAILDCLMDVQKLHVDAVIETCQLPPQTVLNLLLELELRGLVVQHPGKLFTLP